MAELSLPALLGLAVVLGTGHLCAGLAIGWYMGRQSRSAGAGAINVAPLVASVDRLRVEFAELARISREEKASQPIAALVARLTLSIEELHATLSLSSVPPQPPQPPRLAEPDAEASHRLGTHAVSNVRIMEWFRGTSITPRVLDEPLRRYPFAVKQLVAVRHGEPLPEPGEYRVVQCHDLCPTELRYIADDRPKEGDVVIGLGLPRPVKLVTARIEDYRSVYMYGRVGYLVTAQFTGTLDLPSYLEQFGGGDAPSAVPAMSAT